MLVDSNNAYHQRQTRHRTLPKAPKDSSRSKSLSRKEEGSKSLSRKEEASKSLSRKEEGKHSSTSGVMRHPNQLSSSSHQLSGKREEAVEVPVIVDEVTKWISGVNKNTTCRDVISVILRRQNIQGYKVGNRSQHQIGHLKSIRPSHPISFLCLRSQMSTNTLCASAGRRWTDR